MHWLPWKASLVRSSVVTLSGLRTRATFFSRCSIPMASLPSGSFLDGSQGCTAAVSKQGKKHLLMALPSARYDSQSLIITFPPYSCLPRCESPLSALRCRNQLEELWEPVQSKQLMGEFEPPWVSLEDSFRCSILLLDPSIRLIF